MSVDTLARLREKYIGKVMTVEELAEKIPGVWVALKIVDTDPDDARIVCSGEVLDIVLDNDALELMDRYDNDRVTRVMRTTYGMNVGYIDGLYIRVSVK